jgi:hypothetical protein
MIFNYELPSMKFLLLPRLRIRTLIIELKYSRLILKFCLSQFARSKKLHRSSYRPGRSFTNYGALTPELKSPIYIYGRYCWSKSLVLSRLSRTCVGEGESTIPNSFVCWGDWSSGPWSLPVKVTVKFAPSSFDAPIPGLRKELRPNLEPRCVLLEETTPAMARISENSTRNRLFSKRIQRIYPTVQRKHT